MWLHFFCPDEGGKATWQTQKQCLTDDSISASENKTAALETSAEQGESTYEYQINKLSNF